MERTAAMAGDPLLDRALDAMRADRSPLAHVLEPRVIAVVMGRGEKPGGAGWGLLANILAHPFGGVVYPVHPRLKHAANIRSYSHIKDIPEKMDLAVLAVSEEELLPALEECAALGVRGVMLCVPGLVGVDEASVARRERVLEIARSARMRVLGPRVLGILRPATGLNLSFSRLMPLAGHVGAVCQSAAMCSAILDWSIQEHVGFSSFLSVGAMWDIAWGDIIDYLGDDPKTKCIVMSMETMGDPRKFLSAAREVALTKPIIVLKSGKTASGATASARHWGTSATRDDLWDAAFQRAGVLRVDRIADLFALADTLDKQPRPRGPKLTIITNGAGPAVLATDALIAGGGELATLGASSQTSLRTIVTSSDHDAIARAGENPVDLGDDADDKRYAQALEIACADPETHGIMVIFTPLPRTDPLKIAEAVRAAAAKKGSQPLLTSWMGGHDVSRAVKLLAEGGIPHFRYPDAAARVFGMMWRWSEYLKALYETPAIPPGADPLRDRVEEIISHARTRRDASDGLADGADKDLLPFSETMAILDAYGIPSVTQGGVAICEDAPGDWPWPWRLQLVCDPEFGPVLGLGLCGRLGAFFPAPVWTLPALTTTLAQRFLEQHPGVRGLSDEARRDLEGVLVRFSRLAAENAAIAQIDIDPMEWSSVADNSVKAYQVRHALVRLHPASLTASHWPRPAIRPYPIRHCSEWTLKDGTPVVVRPIRPEDEPLLVEYHQALSDQTVALRYFHPFKLSQRIRHERLIRICHTDYDREMALVVIKTELPDETSEPPKTVMLAIGRLSQIPGTREAEFAILVRDRYQGQGLGTELLRRLVAFAREERQECVKAEILRENNEMQIIARKLGFTIEPDPEDRGLVHALLRLTDAD